MGHPLFSPLELRSVTFPNRVGVSPMCQYSSVDGFATDWHLVHLGSRAVGGAGLVILEASAVVPEGRITPADLGIWKDEHIPKLECIATFLQSQGARAGIQLAHAGRKASMSAPWHGERLVPKGEGGWRPVAPSAIAFNEKYASPRELDQAGIDAVVRAFADAAERAERAGFDVVEIHAAHGYLLHEFLSPLSNQRTDRYGGSLENRARLLLDVTDAVRGVWQHDLPLFVRISATDWVQGGWTLEESVEVSRMLKERGTDLIDCSSGGNLPSAKIPVAPGYQVQFAARIKRETGIATAAVGMITEPLQANGIIESGEADMVLLAREMLRNPYFAVHAAAALNDAASWPEQYLRAAPHHSPARTGIEGREQGIEAWNRK